MSEQKIARIVTALPAHPCGCPQGTTDDEHWENHSLDTPGGY